jgi:hypothetical protein
MFEYNVMTGPGAICFVLELADGTHPNVAHCYTLAEARAFLDKPPFDASFATVGDGRDERQVTLDEVRAILAP